MSENIQLTPEQEKKIPSFVKKWEKIGFSTERADWKKADKAIKKCYISGGLKPPTRYVHFASPFIMVMSAGAAKKIIKNEGHFNDSVTSVILDANERVAIYAILAFFDLAVFVNSKNFKDGVDPLTEAPNKPGAALDLFTDKFKKQAVKNILLAAHAEKDYNAEDILEALPSVKLTDEQWNALRSNVRATALDYLDSGLMFGAHDSAWLGLYDFFGRVVKLKKETEKLVGLWALAKTCGWVIPCDRTALASDKPVNISKDNNGNLHRIGGPSVEWSDGWGCFTIHNIRVNPRCVLTPEKITIEEVLKESNAEVRRVLIENYGAERFLADGGYKILAQDSSGILYENANIDKRDAMGLRRILKLVDSTPVNGVNKVYTHSMPVNHPQKNTPLDTPYKCLCWAYGEEEGNYAPLVET